MGEHLDDHKEILYEQV